MERRYKFFATITLLLLALSCWYAEGFYVSAQTSQTDEKLSTANRAIEHAFNAILEAEQSGANVTNLVTQLNAVTNMLAESENSYRNGDFSVVGKVDSVISIAQELTVSATEAKQATVTSSQNAFWLTVSFVVICIAVFILAMLLSWRWFKRRYVNSLYKAKPEVISQ